MAFIRNEYCHHCEAHVYHTNGKCNQCRDREERERIAAWNALTPEEKLQDLRRRVESLEQGPPKYA